MLVYALSMAYFVNLSIGDRKVAPTLGGEGQSCYA